MPSSPTPSRSSFTIFSKAATNVKLADYQTVSGMSSYQTVADMSSYATSSSLSGTYQTIAGMSSYLTTSAAGGSYYPLSGNPSNFLTSAPVTSVSGRTGAITLSVSDVSGAAPTASPSLSGTPTAPTASVGTNTTQIATTAFVMANAGSGGGSSGCNIQTFGSSSSSESRTERLSRHNIFS